MKTVISLVLYSLTLITGGLFGYYKVHSLPSLIAGVTSGIALLLCTYGIWTKKVSSLYLALGITFLLDGFFTQRLIKTASFFPSGLMAILSLSMLAALTLKIRKGYRT